MTSRRTAVIVIAAVGGLLVWTVADPIAGVDLTVGSGSSAQQIGPGAVVVVGLLAGVAAAVLSVLVGRSASKPRLFWTIAAAVVLALSLIGPLGAATFGAGLALVVMHLVVGGTLILGIGSTMAREPEEH
jgi:hypothetical protein